MTPQTLYKLINEENKSFPYDWIKPGEFRCNPNGDWDKNIIESMKKLAQERIESGLEPLFWMKKHDK